MIHGFREAIAWIDAETDRGNLLDVGVGTGVFLHLAREDGWQPSGIDVCELGADKAREEFAAEPDSAHANAYRAIAQAVLEQVGGAGRRAPRIVMQ